MCAWGGGGGGGLVGGWEGLQHKILKFPLDEMICIYLTLLFIST